MEKIFLATILFCVSCTLAQTAPQMHSVSLTWTESQANTTFRVYRTNSQGAYTQPPLASGLSAKSYIDTTAACGNIYFYTVTAVDTVGNESPKSNEISANIPVCVSAPPAPFLNSPSIN